MIGFSFIIPLIPDYITRFSRTPALVALFAAWSVVFAWKKLIKEDCLAEGESACEDAARRDSNQNRPLAGNNLPGLSSAFGLRIDIRLQGYLYVAAYFCSGVSEKRW